MGTQETVMASRATKKEVASILKDGFPEITTSVRVESSFAWKQKYDSTAGTMKRNIGITRRLTQCFLRLANDIGGSLVLYRWEEIDLCWPNRFVIDC